MPYFDDCTQLSNDIQINGVAMPETSSPVEIQFQNISTGGRLADNVDYEGALSGVKVTITLKYARLNKEHFDMLFNASQGSYLNGGSFFMTIRVPTYTPLGLQTFTGYFAASFNVNCTDTTEKHEWDSSYWRGGANYDELHENVVFKFVQK
jgi:hypothetical protein